MVMLRTIERPMKATLRPFAAAASMTCCTRCTWLEKLATMTRRGALAMTLSSTGPMSRSRAVKPGTSAFVESVMKRSTPRSPRRAKARRSVMRRSSGSWSILKSPVCSTVPATVWIATASASGMEWLTATNSRSKGPSFSVCPSFTASVYGWMRCSLSFASMRASVSVEPMRGMSLRRRSRYGTAPMWSSWPCVSTTATMSSRRSRMGEKSGRIRSTPGWCSSGKSTPQSTMSSLPSSSKTAMLRPISPRPPSGMTRSAPGARAGASSMAWGTGGFLVFSCGRPRCGRGGRGLVPRSASIGWCRPPSAGHRRPPRCGRAGSGRGRRPRCRARAPSRPR